MTEKKKPELRRSRPRVQLNTGEKTRVQQHFKHETNVNTIIDKFKQGGGLPIGNSQAQFIDNTQYGDYTEMLSQVTEIQQTFSKFPSNIRSRFGNNPAKYLEFLQDDKNRDEAVKMGLVKPTEKPEAQRTGAPDPEPSSAPPEAPKTAPKAPDTNSEGAKK